MPAFEPVAFAQTAQRQFTPEDWPAPLVADIYLPQADGPHPGVLLVHGGGWARGDREQMSAIARTLAAAGFVVMNASYRFAPEHPHPAQLEDLRVALRWLRAHAEDLGLDRSRIGGFGYSAGGHLVALLALTADAPDTALQAVVAGGAPTDLRKYTGGSLVPDFLGGQHDEVPERFADASPVLHVRSAAPPFFLYHGTVDWLVPIDHAEDFAAALRGAGVHVELYRMRLRGHIGAFLTDGAAVRRAVGFLQRHL